MPPGSNPTHPTSEGYARRKSDQTGLNGWLARLATANNVAKLLGSFVSAFCAFMVVFVAGYSWTMKIDDRTLENRTEIAELDGVVESAIQQGVKFQESIRNQLRDIRESQIRILGKIDAFEQDHNRLEKNQQKHVDDDAHEGAGRKLEKTEERLDGHSQRLETLEDFIRAHRVSP